MKTVDRIALEIAVAEYEGIIMRIATANTGEYDISLSGNDMKNIVSENVKRFLTLAKKTKRYIKEAA